MIAALDRQIQNLRCIAKSKRDILLLLSEVIQRARIVKAPKLFVHTWLPGVLVVDKQPED